MFPYIKLAFILLFVAMPALLSEMEDVAGNFFVV
jgi:hypothetical protein